MNSNAAAIKRRANPSAVRQSLPTQQPPSQQPQVVQRQVSIPPPIPARVEPGQQLTLPQAVQLLEFRVTGLEKSLKEQSQSEVGIPENVNEDVLQVLDEYDERFNMLAGEIKEMKDAISGLKELLLSLQKYTMDVNKVLYEERVRLLSDIEQSEILVDESVEA